MKKKVVLKMALQSDLDFILLTVYRQRLQASEQRTKDFCNWRVCGALHNLIKTHVETHLKDSLSIQLDSHLGKNVIYLLKLVLVVALDAAVREVAAVGFPDLHFVAG